MTYELGYEILKSVVIYGVTFVIGAALGYGIRCISLAAKKKKKEEMYRL